DHDGLADLDLAPDRRGGHLEAVLLLAFGLQAAPQLGRLLLAEAVGVAGDVQLLPAVARAARRFGIGLALGLVVHLVLGLARLDLGRRRRRLGFGCRRRWRRGGAARLLALGLLALALLLQAPGLLGLAGALLLLLQATAVLLVEALLLAALGLGPLRLGAQLRLQLAL